ncbi:MAG: hypothetical protein JRD03_06840 [Deltaproteobacteria bacterium]|nr:hypothetical protein [Deltaproteobacteria bacterium]
MHDTSDLEIRGIPSVYVATTEFVDGADAQAKSLGFAHSPIYVEHPIQDRTDEEMVAIGEQAFDALVAQLVEQE